MAIDEINHPIDNKYWTGGGDTPNHEDIFPTDFSRWRCRCLSEVHSFSHVKSVTVTEDWRGSHPRQLIRGLRLIAPALFALSLAGIAHAQGTMDFSGAQTPMGIFKTFSYVYDRYGNRWQQNAPQGGPAPSYLFNTSPSPSNNQISTAGYDAAGNLTSDGLNSYTYNAEGKVIKSVSAGVTATYAYDALNHRIRTDVGSKATGFVYNAEGRRISYWNAANTQLIQGQVYWGNKPVSFRENGEHFQHQDF